VFGDEEEEDDLTCNGNPEPPEATPGHPEALAKYTMLYDIKYTPTRVGVKFKEF
jgi:hypothetical protein